MKNLFLLGAVAVLGLSACKKDHTCTCTLEDSETKTTLNTKKSVAKAFCEDEGYEVVKYEVDGEDYTDEYKEWQDSDWSCSLD